MSKVNIGGFDYDVVKSSAVLESDTRLGQRKFWQAHIVRDGEKHYLTSSYWQNTKTGKQSKVQYATPYRVFVKNVGRSNQTTIEEQASDEYDTMVSKQKDKGYVEPGQKSTVMVLPMLAHKIQDKLHHVAWPAFVQPKLNGMRMLYDGNKAWSRGNKEIIPACVAHLAFDTEGYIMDGELILPSNPLLQDTMSAAKKFYPNVSPKLTYQVYDIVEPNLTFAERNAILTKLSKKFPKQVILVETHPVKDQAELVEYHTKFVKEGGYEGAMIRNAAGKYTIGQRSSDLLKVKVFQDAEFKIVNVVEGEGNSKGLAIFECVIPKGRKMLEENPKLLNDRQFRDNYIFGCNPEGTKQYRAGLWKQKDTWVGQWLTVRFQEYTKSGKPQFPVGVVIREKGDF